MVNDGFDEVNLDLEPYTAVSSSSTTRKGKSWRHDNLERENLGVFSTGG